MEMVKTQANTTAAGARTNFSSKSEMQDDIKINIDVNAECSAVTKAYLKHKGDVSGVLDELFGLG